MDYMGDFFNVYGKSNGI